ncbi:MAG: arsenosugar biosynthesis radical SAM protein ArsS [Lentisphaeraceae bacterium]|nr:arsenosugar biosynthesis radical SAM protein ArsS [Lentisphaeraceae bacterium]
MKTIIKDFPEISRVSPDVLQINVGKKCNQTCTHCHVSAGPDREEDLEYETAQKIIQFAEKYHFKTADITGGAPEINKQFPILLERLSELCDEVIVRCNLTAAMTRRKSIGDLFQKFRPHLVASMPCYEEGNVDKQRGDGVFDKSIKALQWLNELDFGSKYKLTLVYNPIKAVLPPSSDELEKAYRKIFRERYGIEFTDLIAIANVPVGRFREDLESSGILNTYIDLLREHHNPANIPGLMCRSQINVDWQGRVFDCDFNNQIELHPFGKAIYIDELNLDAWKKQKIAVRDHCFTCTAGSGSSCGGAISD